MSTTPNPHWHCYLCGSGTGTITWYDSLLSKRFCQRRIIPKFSHSITFRCSGKCLIACYGKFPSFFQIFIRKFSVCQDVQLAVHKFLSFMCPKQCQYEHAGLSCSCLYLQSYCSHEQIEDLKYTKSSETSLESSAAFVSLDLSPSKSGKSLKHQESVKGCRAHMVTQRTGPQ